MFTQEKPFQTPPGGNITISGVSVDDSGTGTEERAEESDGKGRKERDSSSVRVRGGDRESAGEIRREKLSGYKVTEEMPMEILPSYLFINNTSVTQSVDKTHSQCSLSGSGKQSGWIKKDLGCIKNPGKV